MSDSVTTWAIAHQAPPSMEAAISFSTDLGRTLKWLFTALFWSCQVWSEMKSLSHVQLFVTPWTVAYKAPLSMGFSRQQYWSGLPYPSLVIKDSSYIYMQSTYFLSKGGIWWTILLKWLIHILKSSLTKNMCHVKFFLIYISKMHICEWIGITLLLFFYHFCYC